jgi:CheY-like chemotaxis protein
LIQDTAERTWAAVGPARAEAALRASDRRKDEFLATLAHELRNPLAPLRNGLQITRMKCPADPMLTRAVDMMDRQLSHLVRLVDDLLDVGRINTGKLELRRQSLKLSDVLASSIEAVRVLLESRRHDLVVELGPGSRTVLGDFDRLSQIFINLLTNAAKYTEPGGRIRVSLSQDGGHELVRVEDTGIGIAAEDLPKVFELFSQVRTVSQQGGSGLGIGLSLVRRLVELHGGTVEAESRGTGQGSAFVVRLPVQERAGWLMSDRQEQDCDAVVTSRRVLVVDDNVEAADSLASVLQLMGHETAVAYDGLGGIELAKRMKPDVVLLDLGMPTIDGLETARRLRALASLEGIRIVAVTGWGLDSDRARTREAGFDAHLVKPVDVSTLEDVLADLTPRAA